MKARARLPSDQGRYQTGEDQARSCSHAAGDLVNLDKLPARTLEGAA